MLVVTCDDIFVKLKTYSMQKDSIQMISLVNESVSVYPKKIADQDSAADFDVRRYFRILGKKEFTGPLRFKGFN